MSGWIGVDLDGTLAFYDKWRGPDHIGEPIMPMVDRIKRWIAEGREVRIMTARAFVPEGDLKRASEVKAAKTAIQMWLRRIGLPALRITCVKDFEMIELWDDRAVQVIPNTGRTITDELEAVRSAHTGKVASPATTIGD